MRGWPKSLEAEKEPEAPLIPFSGWEGKVMQRILSVGESV